MKVLDLKCAQQHVFEGWFGSENDFQSQLARRLIACPLCGDSRISKQPSAARLNLGAAPPAIASHFNAGSGTAPAAASSSALADNVTDRHALQTQQAAWMQMVKHVMAHTEDVGSSFAEVARQMHYGETDARSIRGQTSAKEAVALLEEGITVLPLPLPEVLKGPLQ